MRIISRMRAEKLESSISEVKHCSLHSSIGSAAAAKSAQSEA